MSEFNEILQQVTVRMILEDAGIKAQGNRIACPIHGGSNKTAFKFSDDGYHCFSCGVSGGLISLVQQLHDQTKPEAVKHLCSLAGITYRPDSTTGIQTISPRPRIYFPKIDPILEELEDKFEWLKLQMFGDETMLRIIKAKVKAGTLSWPAYYAERDWYLYCLEEGDARYAVINHKITIRKGQI